MNNKSSQWLALAGWFRQREQLLRRAGGMRASVATPPLPSIKDPEVLAFAQSYKDSQLGAGECRTLDIRSTYQAVLADPRSEEELLKAAGYLDDTKKLDALYEHAKQYTKSMEKQAKLELASRKTGRGGLWLQIIGLSILLVMASVGSWVYFGYKGMKRYLERPAGDLTKKISVVIPKGSRPHQVAKILAEKQVISDQEKFYSLARYYPYWKRVFPQLPGSGQMRAGSYIFPPELTPIQLFSRLRKGPKKRSIRVTIPEGFNIFKIAARLEKKRICRAEAFLYLARNAAYASRVVGWETPSVEGYLYPDTYRFYKNSKPAKVISRMVKRFKQMFSNEFNKRMRELNEESDHIVWNAHKITTLASIIEKETGQKRERPMISSVFHNRLKRRWKLQTDPTVIYGLLPDFDGNIRKKDLRNPHKYNTYEHKGLPPGPIASPGVKAIRAALWPTKSRNMYFVSKNDGSHIFSRTLREHNRYVAKYQAKRTGKRKRRRKKRR